MSFYYWHSASGILFASAIVFVAVGALMIGWGDSLGFTLFGIASISIGVLCIWALVNYSKEKIPEWRSWPLIVFGAFGGFFLFEGENLGLGMAFLFLAALSVWVLKPDMSNPVSKEEKASNVEEIKCTNCQQRLNIPVGYTGMAGCPACKKKNHLEGGVITN